MPDFKCTQTWYEITHFEQGITTEDIPFSPKFVRKHILKAVYNYKMVFVPEYFEQKYPRGLAIQELKMPTM